jgi:hypothetical protein
MKKLFLLTLFCLLPLLISAQNKYPYTFYYNDHVISIDTFSNKNTSGSIVIDKESTHLLSLKINVALADSIQLEILDTSYYPQKIQCSYDGNVLNSKVIKTAKPAFRSYTIGFTPNKSGKNDFLITFNYGKKFHFYDLLVVPAIRHCFYIHKSFVFSEF